MLKSRGLRRDPLCVPQFTLSLYYYFLLNFFDLHISDNQFSKVSYNFHPHLHLTTSNLHFTNNPSRTNCFRGFHFPYTIIHHASSHKRSKTNNWMDIRQTTLIPSKLLIQTAIIMFFPTLPLTVMPKHRFSLSS